MARQISRTAGLTAAVAGLALTVGCQAPGGAGYATMRFAMDRQGERAGAAASGAAAAPAAGVAPAGLPAAALAGAAPLLVSSDVAPALPPAEVATAGRGGGSRASRPAPAATFEVAHPAAGPGSTTITFNLGGAIAGAAQRRLLATIADIDHVVITISPTSGASASQTIPAAALSGGAGSVTFTGLPPTAATATIQAFDALGNEIGKGTQQLVIDPAVPTLVNFTVTLNPTYVPPTGTVSANVTIVDGPVIAGTPPPGTVFRPGQKIAELTGFLTPQAVVFDAAGTTAWVPSFGNDRLFALDRQVKQKAVFPVKLPTAPAGLRPVDLAFDPAGGMWIANYAASSVSQVDPTNGAILSTVVTGPNPVDIEFIGAVMHVLSHPGDVIQRFTTAGAPAGLPIPVNPLVRGTGRPAHLPVRMKVSAANEIWVVNLKSDTVSRLSSAGLPIASIAVGDEPEGLVFGAGDVAWVTNNRGGTVSKINMTANAVEATYPVGKRPRGIDIDKNGNLWVACSEANQVVRLSPAGVVLGRYATAKDPREVTVDPVGAVWVACGASGVVQKFAP